MIILRNTQHKRNGYSLVELAIVLGVVGTVIAAIWSCASIAYERVRRERMLEETRVIVDNMRSAYTGQMGIPLLGFIALVPTLVQNHTIPSEMERLPLATACTNNLHICVDTPWGSADPTDYPAAPNTPDPHGNVRVCDWTLGQTGCNSGGSTGAAQNFGIVIRNLAQDACIALSEKISSAAGPTGLVEANINGCDIVENLGCGGYVPTPSFPVTPADATNLCSNTNSDNEVRMVYRLRLPQN
jgi:type II secretory pathway pseudopilin PulG